MHEAAQNILASATFAYGKKNFFRDVGVIDDLSLSLGFVKQRMGSFLLLREPSLDHNQYDEVLLTDTVWYRSNWDLPSPALLKMPTGQSSDTGNEGLPNLVQYLLFPAW